jgi:hypothetical protein
MNNKYYELKGTKNQKHLHSFIGAGFKTIYTNRLQSHLFTYVQNNACIFQYFYYLRNTIRLQP